MTVDLIGQDQPIAATERALWQAPRVTRFGAAGAMGGDITFNNADGDTSKS